MVCLVVKISRVDQSVKLWKIVLMQRSMSKVEKLLMSLYRVYRTNSIRDSVILVSMRLPKMEGKVSLSGLAHTEDEVI